MTETCSIDWSWIETQLHHEGIRLPASFSGDLATFFSLIHEWNEYAGLVSPRDLHDGLTQHVWDSLSLAAVIQDRCKDGLPWLDIGSGGGFPAIPIALALPAVSITLVERNERRAAFLQRVLHTFNRPQATVLPGSFPEMVHGQSFSVITARAVDHPARVWRAMVPFIAGGAHFACQWGQPLPDGVEKFHVERIQDAWSEAGVRRGALMLIKN